MNCPKCGTEHEVGFCPNCGSAGIASNQPHISTISPTTASTPPPHPPKKKKIWIYVVGGVVALIVVSIILQALGIVKPREKTNQATSTPAIASSSSPLAVDPEITLLVSAGLTEEQAAYVLTSIREHTSRQFIECRALESSNGWILVTNNGGEFKFNLDDSGKFNNLIDPQDQFIIQGGTANPSYFDFDSVSQSEVAAQIEELINSALIAPASAEYQSIFDWSFEVKNGDTLVVTTYVDSQNSFGAMLRNDIIAHYAPQNGELFLVYLQLGEEALLDKPLGDTSTSE